MGTLQAAKRTSKVLITAFKKHVLNIKDEEKVVGPEELAELLRTLRIARVDYTIIRPYANDRLFICLTAALSTLQKWADFTGKQARLIQFRTEVERKLHNKTAEVPHARFRLETASEFLPFRSRERIELLTGILEGKNKGCSLDLNRMLYRELVLDHYAVHHQHERRLLYQAWAAAWTASPIWPPHVPETFLS